MKHPNPTKRPIPRPPAPLPQIPKPCKPFNEILDDAKIREEITALTNFYVSASKIEASIEQAATANPSLN